MLEQHTIDKLRAIQHMLRTDEHTRSHWLFWTVMSEMSPYIESHYLTHNLDVPCGAVGCAVGHAHRLGIVSTNDFIAVRDELEMNKDDYHYVFENDQFGRDYDTPDDVIARIDEVIERHEIIERVIELAPDGVMETTDA